MVHRFERFSLAIFEISRCWHKIAAEEMEKYGLRGPYATYLTTLYRQKEGVSASRLGTLCGKDKADVSRAVAVMEQIAGRLQQISRNGLPQEQTS